MSGEERGISTVALVLIIGIVGASVAVGGYVVIRSEGLEKTPEAESDIQVSGLSVSDKRIAVGNSVIVEVEVVNRGDAEGTQEIPLEINGEIVDEQEVTLESDKSKTISFEVVKQEVGNYSVSVEELSEDFEVVEPAEFEFFDLEISDEFGKLAYSVGIDSRVEVKEVIVESTVGKIIEEVGRKKKFEVSGTIEADAGEIDKIKATVITVDNVEISKSRDSYVRKYNFFEFDRNIDVGAVYIPFMHDKWEKCAVGEPSIGPYSTEEHDFAHRAVNRHIDQMQGFGISTLMFNFGESKLDYGRFRAFEETTLADKIEIEVFYVVSQAMRRDRDVQRDFEFIRKNFLPRKNYKTREGRPVIYFWGVGFLGWGGNPESKRVAERIRDEWGDLRSFIDYIRSELTIDGVEPFMVGNFGNLGYQYLEWGGNENILKMVPRFDALTTWTGHNPPGETVPWIDQYNFVEQNFEGMRELAEKYNLDFAPMVFPGFDDRANECWGENRYTPRDPSHLQELLELADEHRTIDRINIATWNGWNEGHMIEPGEYRGQDYGTDYLEVLKEFLEND